MKCPNCKSTKKAHINIVEPTQIILDTVTNTATYDKIKNARMIAIECVDCGWLITYAFINLD